MMRILPGYFMNLTGFPVGAALAAIATHCSVAAICRGQGRSYRELAVFMEHPG
jgi:hypothetical protein